MFNIDNVEPLEFHCGVCKVRSETFCVHCGTDRCPEHLESGYCFECYQAFAGKLPNRFSGPDHYFAWLVEWQQMRLEQEGAIIEQLHATRTYGETIDEEVKVRNPDAISVDLCSDRMCRTSAIATCGRCGRIFCASHMEENEDYCLACVSILEGEDDDE